MCLYGRTLTELREAENPNHMSQTDRHIDEGRVPRTDDQVQSRNYSIEEEEEKRKECPFLVGDFGWLNKDYQQLLLHV